MPHVKMDAAYFKITVRFGSSGFSGPSVGVKGFCERVTVLCMIAMIDTAEGSHRHVWE